MAWATDETTTITEPRCEDMTTNTMEKTRETPVTRVERPSQRREFIPACDIVESKEDLQLFIDMPGAKSESVELDLKNGALTITARVEDRVPADMNFLLREYGIGDFRRSFNIGEGIDANEISAALRNGVLTVTLPKSEAIRPRKIEVKNG